MSKLSEFIEENWQWLVVAGLLALAILYSWNRHYLIVLESHLTGASSVKESLLDEQKKLRMEVAELKKPERIFWVAVTKLQMTYPKQEQIIKIKKSHPDGWTLNGSWLDIHSATF